MISFLLAACYGWLMPAVAGEEVEEKDKLPLFSKGTLAISQMFSPKTLLRFPLEGIVLKESVFRDWFMLHSEIKTHG